MVSSIALFISVLINAILVYAVWNLIRTSEDQEEHIEVLENRITNFFLGAQDVLSNMRMLDDRQIFEKDDEVGVLFAQLTVIIGELRILLYGEEKEEEYILDE